MFYRLITQKCNQWIKSPDCPVNYLLDYIATRGMMRDAQVDAIKTYLFLKIAARNRPLWELFSEGFFNTRTADDVPVTAAIRDQLTPAALALLDYAQIKKDNKHILAPELERLILENPASIDCSRVFKDLFYKVDYTDYLFSLPMGAGKTFLMGAFIYLDLYFAQNEPDNPSFAHNFIIFAPSGLKASVVPSLRTIERFDPSWVIPEPAASQLKRLIKFEILDAQKAQKKSNRAKNPNAQKINAYQPLGQLLGLVAVTNAEKVILDRVEVDANMHLIERTDDEKERQANELRSIIGRIPNLAVYIDEVHHAVSDDIKLRAVVNKWTEKGTINSVVGFSGTPYLEKAESVEVIPDLKVKNIELSNVVHYYPLVQGLGNFLKVPRVETITSKDSLSIVEAGLTRFFEQYKDTVYGDGTGAKIAVYCGSIETLEESVYPRAVQIAESFGLLPDEAILKYHGGNKTYPKSQEAETAFTMLDHPQSKKRIILLVQIGKEGWDCRSLTGVVLSQKGDCPNNMVLQTSCRCLRQVDRGQTETALICLNDFNSSTLDKQLKQQENISLKEFNAAGPVNKGTDIERFSRLEKLQLPTLDFYQLRVDYQTLIVSEPNPSQWIAELSNEKFDETNDLIIAKDLRGQQLETSVLTLSVDELMSFSEWLALIAKESFGFVSLASLETHVSLLRSIYANISCEKEGLRYLRPQFNHERIRERIRIAFAPRRDLKIKHETISQKARLLFIDKLTSPIQTAQPEKFIPSQKAVELIRTNDADGALSGLIAKGVPIQHDTDIQNSELTYHYIPYHLDSDFERHIFNTILTHSVFKDNKLELYYNGDRHLSDFKIRCFKKQGQGWHAVGDYTPDFLLIKRKGKAIHQAVIIETKGRIYASDSRFLDRRTFMDEVFIKENNERFGYPRFSFLYLEDTEPIAKSVKKIEQVIQLFFANTQDAASGI